MVVDAAAFGGGDESHVNPASQLRLQRDSIDAVIEDRGRRQEQRVQWLKYALAAAQAPTARSELFDQPDTDKLDPDDQM